MAQDLTSKHHLIGRLFTWPRSEAEWQVFKLSADQVSFYRQNGYLAGIKLLNDEQVAALCTEVDELTNPTHPGRQLSTSTTQRVYRIQTQFSFMRSVRGAVTPGLHDVLWNRLL
jgi:hypothetical protein